MIRDDGVGIPQEHLSRIFDPFFTTRQVGQGAGLGRTVTYGVVEQHRGEIRIESEPGCGTTVTISLPADG